MQNINKCPVCEKPKYEILHTMNLENRYSEPPTGLESTNNYERNFLLFKKILVNQKNQLRVDFRLCQGCGLIYFSPRPDENDLLIKYQSIAESKITEHRESRRRLVDLRHLRAAKIFERVRPHVTNVSNRALDVGGADGHCLAEFTEEFDCNILDYEDREMWPGVKRLGATHEDLLPNDLFDVILCCHVLEHIPSPKEFLDAIRWHLVDGGILYIEVPNGCSGEIFGTGNILTHINFFSEGSLGSLLEHVGLRVEAIKTGPVLSAKRYLPVVTAVARQDSSGGPEDRYIEDGYSITKRQMADKPRLEILFANIRLVLSHPMQYTRNFLKRFVR